ncbi:MAG: peptidylprolyl isomerase [FCB group bacterium]|nr:peptidylprolyl isomerase [FCB group bacterium]
MKKILFWIIAVMLVFTACSEKAKLTPAQKEFFEAMGTKIPYMKPDTTVVLATTTHFDIKNKDIMENVYQGMRGDLNIIYNVDPARIEAFIMQIVSLKAQQDILLHEAKQHGLSIPKDTVEAYIEKYLYEPNGGKEAFLEQIKFQQIDMDFIREDTRNNLLIMKYIEEVAMAGVDASISEAEIRAYYEDNKAHYNQETATVRHILFLTQGKSDTEKSNVKKSAEEILKRAKGGEDFIKLVEQYSEDPGSRNAGGLYEDFPRGRMVQSFEDASFTLPVGSISNLVETPYGYHIIKIENRKAGKKLEDVRGEIETILADRALENAFPPILDSLVEKYEFRFTF